MTIREWLRRAIAQAEGTALRSRYYDRRLVAATRARTLRHVLNELERAGVDVLPRFPTQNCKGGRQ